MKCFQGIVVPPVEIIVAIWKELVMTLRGQYDMLLVSFDVRMGKFIKMAVWLEGEP